MMIRNALHFARGDCSSDDPMKIPVRNIYFLLCYAWDRWKDGEDNRVEGGDSGDVLAFLTQALLRQCTELFRSGMERGYEEVYEEIPGIKGRIDFSGSLHSQSFRSARAYCYHDELTYNTLPNQLIRSTLGILVRSRLLDKTLAAGAREWYYALSMVDEIPITSGHFSRVRIHRNNARYGFILNLCAFITANLLPDAGGRQAARFKDFLRDEREMAVVFERFVRNFYRSELSGVRVEREDIRWNAIPVGASDPGLLPRMQTDTSIRGNGIHWVIETKYYADALQRHYGTPKFHSGNLYQLYCYLDQLRHSASGNTDDILRGVLLYPVNGDRLDERFTIGGLDIHVRTVDLSKDWRDIRREMLDIVGARESTSLHG
jgi:5-methylcytosine-specific restriction enzyme subunit McrC